MIAPAGEGSVGGDRAGVLPADHGGNERTVRRNSLPIGVVSPAGDALVGANRARVIASGDDGRERALRRRLDVAAEAQRQQRDEADYPVLPAHMLPPVLLRILSASDSSVPEECLEIAKGESPSVERKATRKKA